MTSCTLPEHAMPSTDARVVLRLGETALIGSRTRRFMSADLPAFGVPTMHTYAAFFSIVSGSIHSNGISSVTGSDDAASTAAALLSPLLLLLLAIGVAAEVMAEAALA